VECLTATFQFVGENTASENALRSALHCAGIELRQPDHNQTVPDGILCFQELKERAFEMIRFERARLQGQVLVIAAGERLSSGVLWRLVNSGASDVLPCEDLELVCKEVRAKLQRSVTVRTLVTKVCTRRNLVGECPRWLSFVTRVVESAHFSASPILLFGESGTGKEVLAVLSIHCTRRVRKWGHPGIWLRWIAALCRRSCQEANSSVTNAVRLRAQSMQEKARSRWLMEHPFS
jgi:hypothetical protein